MSRIRISCMPKRLGIAAIGFGLFCVTFVLAAASYAKIDMNSVVGLWLLDENEDDIAIDSSGNGHDGTLKGNPQWDEGKFGDCLVFNGSGSVVDCGNDESLNLEVFTVSFWASVPTTQGWNHMVSKGDHVAAGTPGSVNWGVMMRDGEARFLFEIYEDTAWAGISSPAVGIDEWQHLAATYDGDKMEFFLNGASLGTQSGITINLDADRSFMIGARGSVAPAAFFNGAIDEVALFDEVLAPEDIRSLMDNGIEEAMNLMAVSPAGNSIATWARIKRW